MRTIGTSCNRRQQNTRSSDSLPKFLRPQGLQLVQSFSWIAAFMAAVWGRCLNALSRWAFYASLLLLAHGSLRRAQSEAGAGPVRGVTFRQALSLE